MLADRMIRIILGVIAVMLVALFLEIAIQSPTEAQAAYPDSNKVYDARLITKLSIPEAKEVVALPTNDSYGTNFAVRTATHVYVFRCDYFNRSQ